LPLQAYCQCLPRTMQGEWMSGDLVKVQSAAHLRSWEEKRIKRFDVWHTTVQQILVGLRSAFQLGVAQHRQLDEFLRRRCAADQAYAKALHPYDAPIDQSCSTPAAAKSVWLNAVEEIQKSMSNAREAFALGLCEGAMLDGLVLHLQSLRRPVTACYKI